jgi:hypothetical protein
MEIVRLNNKIHDTDHKFTFMEILDKQKCNTTTNSGKKKKFSFTKLLLVKKICSVHAFPSDVAGYIAGHWLAHTNMSMTQGDG